MQKESRILGYSLNIFFIIPTNTTTVTNISIFNLDNPTPLSFLNYLVYYSLFLAEKYRMCLDVFI